MDSYVKSVIFTLILACSLWEIIYTQAANPQSASSSTFIQQESNQPQKQNLPQSNPVISTPNRGNSRDYVNPNIPQGVQNSGGHNIQNIPNQNNPQSVSVTSTPNRGGNRDYVNPNLPQNTGGQNIQNPQNPNFPSLNNPQAGPGNPGNTGNSRGGSRDYVRPQSPQNPNARTVPTQPSSIQTGTNRGAVRDYVNPSQGQISSGQNPGNRQQQFRPSPRNSNLGGRDYINPNFQTSNNPLPQGGKISYAGIAGGNTQSNFPALPSRNNPPPPQNLPPTTPISYASKVSGGATTKSPIGQQKPSPSVLGPTSSTTEKIEKSEEGPTDVELRDFSEALLRKDVNNAAKFLTVNVQGKTTSQSKNDEAPEKLLQIQEAAYQISTISKLKLLHNNYVLETTENEFVTALEKQEESDLLDSMLTTPIMQHTRNFLISKGKLNKDPKDFKNLLKLLWFNMYSRGGGRIGSSGFEHIFLAELKNKEVSGLHNWVYFDEAEMKNIVDYLGYMKKIDLGEKGAILKFHFKLNGVDKPVGSMFIGTSPELEMALYTTCYMFRADRICPLRLNGNNFIVRTYNYRYRGKNMIGSAFPEI